MFSISLKQVYISGKTPEYLADEINEHENTVRKEQHELLNGQKKFKNG
jgi:hypothetical protein